MCLGADESVPFSSQLTTCRFKDESSSRTAITKLFFRLSFLSRVHGLTSLQSFRTGMNKILNESGTVHEANNIISRKYFIFYKERKVNIDMSVNLFSAWPSLITFEPLGKILLICPFSLFNLIFSRPSTNHKQS